MGGFLLPDKFPAEGDMDTTHMDGAGERVPFYLQGGFALQSADLCAQRMGKTECFPLPGTGKRIAAAQQADGAGEAFPLPV